jgi:hypothetical protein
VTEWSDLFAVWLPTSTAHVRDLAVVDERRRRSIEWAMDDLEARLLEEYAIPLEPFRVQLVDSRFPGPPDELVLVEVHALRLETPNPFPRLRLFRWLPA